MSRVGKQPVSLPSGVSVAVQGQNITVKGPKGELSREIRDEVAMEVDGQTVTVSLKKETLRDRAFHGLERALLSNMVAGVSEGFVKELELIGVGYRAEVKGKVINLGLGYSHPIDFPVPEGISASVVKDGRQIFLRLEGIDKQLVGQTAAEIRRLRAPEPYKGKGVRYRGEHVKLKAGKSGKK